MPSAKKSAKNQKGPERSKRPKKPKQSDQERKLKTGEKNAAAPADEGRGTGAAAGRATRDAPVPPAQDPDSGKRPFPLVGIGASAGGLEALEAFFENLPADSGMAFVVVTHTDPQHNSLLPGIIGRKTPLAVEEIQEGLSPVPNSVYLPPTDRDLFIEGGRFRLQQRPARGDVHMPVDFFLKHLAAARGEQAVCVILSGTGSDGTHGLRAIKEQAGLALVQEPRSARHGGMPQSAIDTGLSDFVLAPAEMPAPLIDYFKHPALRKPPVSSAGGSEADPLGKILALLAQRTRHDFNLYKDGTLTRRIAHRIAVTRCRGAAEYLKILQRDSREVQALFQDLLIGVTSFFRDPEAFAHLKAHALPKIFRGKPRGETLRAWVPGCATGEEAYSLAIIIQEYLTEKNISAEMQIFGTDIDAAAIETARTGEYLLNISTEVSPERLARFFSPSGEGYRIKRQIRETLIFAEQNLLRDPPFSDLDLLVCRNLLIYLKRRAQERLIPLFHYTLKPGGFLFLGNSESIGRFPELFAPASKSHSIYRRREGAGPRFYHFPSGKTGLGTAGGGVRSPRETGEADAGSLARSVERLLADQFGPACAVVNANNEILYTRGRTGKFLELAPGKPTLNIADMSREGLRFPLIAALGKARESKMPIYEKGLGVKIDGERQWIDLTVKKLRTPALPEALLVLFEERAAPAPKTGSPNSTLKEADPAEAAREEAVQRVPSSELERELTRVREDYRGALEELETSNDELHSAYEEMQSANEELQSTNEELESSREELQSLNEELSTVNSELQNKIEELDQSFQALSDALNSIRIAIIYLDSRLRVVRFTAMASRLINLIDSDLGRPLAHIAHNLELDDLPAATRGVLDSLTPLEREVSTRDGQWYRMNIRVHRQSSRLIQGVVLTFINIDPQKKAQREMERMKAREVDSARRLAESIVDTVRESLLVLDEQLRVIHANRRFYQLFDTRPESTEGQSLFQLGAGQWDIPELRGLLEQTAQKRQSFEDFRFEQRFANIGRKQMLLNACFLEQAGEEQNRILLAIQDLSAP